MRTFSSVLLLAALVPAVAAQEHATPTKPETQKPEVKVEKTDKAAMEPKVLSLGNRANGGILLKDIDGNEHRAKSFQGKITVVNFYSIECPIQAAWDDRLAAIQNEFSGKDVMFLSIDSNVGEIGETAPQAKDGEKPYENIRKHLKAKKLPFKVLVDHGNVVADAWGAKTTPDVFVFGKDGKLVYRGLVDNDQANKLGDKATRHLHDVLGKLVAGEKVEASQTTPQGCGIKRVKKAASAPAAAPAKTDKE